MATFLSVQVHTNRYSPGVAQENQTYTTNVVRLSEITGVLWSPQERQLKVTLRNGQPLLLTGELKEEDAERVADAIARAEVDYFDSRNVIPLSELLVDQLV